ncbi:MAG: AbrB/MazE/SpoVT family DNA-binding domain-containing protein, partial [Thermoplasmata archaeon]
KVTVAGQVTLPKKLRDHLGIEEGTLVEFVSMGNAVVLRKLRGDRDFLRKVRAKIKKSGLTKKQVLRLVEEAAAEEWKGTYDSDIR